MLFFWDLSAGLHLLVLFHLHVYLITAKTYFIKVWRTFCSIYYRTSPRKTNSLNFYFSACFLGSIHFCFTCNMGGYTELWLPYFNQYFEYVIVLVFAHSFWSKANFEFLECPLYILICIPLTDCPQFSSQEVQYSFRRYFFHMLHTVCHVHNREHTFTFLGSWEYARSFQVSSEPFIFQIDFHFCVQLLSLHWQSLISNVQSSVIAPNDS